MKGCGTLTIKPVSAQLTRDTEFLGKMDPYCEIKIGNQEQRTRVHNNADIIQFLVWDKDTMSKNDLVGEGSAAITKYKVNDKQSDYVLLSYKGKQAGKVLIETQWFPDHKDMPAQQQQPLYNQQQPSVIGMGGAGMYPMQSQFQAPPPQYPPQNLYQSSPGYGQQPPPAMYGSCAPPMGGYQQQPMGGYQQQPMGGYQQQGYQQQPMGGYQQQPMGGYQQQPPYPMMSSYTPPQQQYPGYPQSNPPYPQY